MKEFANPYSREKLVLMHRFAMILLLACLAPFGTAAAAADTWPSRPVHLIVPFAAGGSTDLVARQIGNELSKRIGQPVVVENKAGAGGLIGSSFVAKQPPDGYTLLMGTVSTHAIAPSVYANVPYDIIKDFTPLTMIGTIPDLIVVNPSVPAKNLKEFITLAKSKPDIVTYASGGKGTSSHLGSEYFAAEAGIKLNHIPYKGSGPALVDVLAGNVDMMLDVVMTSLEPLKAGRLRALAITSKTRSPLLPDVPTVAESGIPGFEAIIWFGMFGPAGMAPELQQRIAGNLDAILNQPEMKQFLLKQGIQAAGNGPGPFAAQIKGDLAKWQKVAQIAKITPE